MVNEIISGVSMKLNEVFGDSYRIYKNDVKQGLSEPCFFIAALAPFHSPYLGRRRKITIPLDVHFFPVDGGDNGEMMQVGDQLFFALEFIAVPEGDHFRGREMRYEIQENVMHFFVTYSMVLNELTEEAAMEDIRIEAETDTVIEHL